MNQPMTKFEATLEEIVQENLRFHAAKPKPKLDKWNPNKDLRGKPYNDPEKVAERLEASQGSWLMTMFYMWAISMGFIWVVNGLKSMLGFLF